MSCKIFLIILFLYSCKTRITPVAQPTSNIQLSLKDKSDKQIEDLITPYKLGMAAAMNEVIGHSPSFVEKKKPSSALGNFMADAVMESALKAYPLSTICILNYGGIRSTLDSGDITMGDIFQIMPFENEIVILKLNTTYIDSLQNFITTKGGEPMSDNINSLKQVVMNDQDYFYLVTSDYMANGGDNYLFLIHATERINTGIKIRDALIAYVKIHQHITFDTKIRKL